MTTEKRSAAWYEQVLDAMTEFVLVKGDRSKLLWANKAFRDYYGMTAEELEDIVDAPHSDPDDTVQYVKDDHRVFTSGQTLDIPSEPITDANGSVAYYHTIKTPIRDAAGQIVRTVGVSRPILDRDLEARSVARRADRKEHLEELRALVHHIPLAVAMFDVRNRFLCHSRSWSDLFESGDRPLLGSFYDDLFEPCLALERAMAEATTNDQSARFEAVPMRGLRGRREIVDVEIRPWSLPDGGVGGVIVLVRDVTEMKMAQRELERLNGELMQFNYRVSHDLMAPLRTVRGFIELSRDELDDGNLDEVRTYHQMIHESVVRLASLVEDVLDLARADMMDFEVEQVELDALVREIADKHCVDIESAGITLTVDCQDAHVWSQRVRVLQILENVIANAIKYRDPAKSEHMVRVRARAHTESSGEGGVIVTVADNGIGFDDDLQDDIFDIFKRGTSKYPGSGLGLYIVKKHTDRLNGQVHVLSNRDDTIFEITIPDAKPATT